MRLRFWLYALFGAFSLIPLIFLGYWVHNSSTLYELERAGHNHQLLAENHAKTIDRHLRTAIRIFDSQIPALRSRRINNESMALLSSIDLGVPMLVDGRTGELLSSSDQSGGVSTQPGAIRFISEKTLALLSGQAREGQTSVTPVTSNDWGKNVVYLVHKLGNFIVASEMGTDFFVTLASSTRFDRSGFAAIVDSQQQLISHPNTRWQNAHKFLGDIEAVQMAANGETGFDQYVDQATGTEMIAGFANIPSANWSILIQQPVQEIRAQAGLAKKSVITAALLTLALVLLSSILLSYIFSRPVERLIAALSATGSDDRFKLLDTSENRFVPTEYHEMQDTFNAMIRRLDNNHQSMVKMAFSDPVTTLPNRESFRKTLETTLASLALKSVRGTMAFIDIDNFKEINDTHGHHVGDQVLRCLGSRISGIIETASGHFPGSIYSTANDLTGDGLPKPILARFGGDEFVMFLAENSEISHSDEIFEQILLAISSPIPGLETSIELSGSIGLACFPEQGLTYSDLVKRADIAMYHAKKMGKGMIQKFGDGTGEQSQAEIRRDVHLAIINDELELFYQPKINTSDYEVHGVEALIRWIHPVRGLISPGEFIPAIENSDTTNELGEWVIRRACRDMKTFDARGFDLNIAVNIAARQFVSADFAKRIGEIIHEEGCTPERFEIEVTEETALATHQGAADIISKLHEMGFRVSLDDYGRGYSNLTRLSELRVNTLKIDGPLTARITRDKRTRVIFEATINMANGLECKTVAEGVESAEEAAILTRLGCTELQGYYFSTPLPASNMITWLEDRRRSPASALQEKLVANYS